MGIVETISKLSTTKKMNLYAAILIVVAILPVWVTLGIPIAITYTTQDFYNSIVKLPQGSVIVFGWQTMRTGDYIGSEDVAAAVFKLIHQRKLKIVCLSLGPAPPLFFEDIYKRNKLVALYGLKYGEDYVITPYIAGEEAALAAFAKDTWATVSTDIYNTPIKDIPLMQRVRTLNDVDLCWMASYSWSNFEQFVRQWGHAYNKPLILWPGDYWAIAQFYPWPVTGVLSGIRGAAEFEALTGFGGAELARLEAQSTFGLAYLLFIAGGLVAYRLFRKTVKKEVPEE